MVNDLILILQFCLVLRNIVLQLFFVLFETFHHLREFHNNIGQDVILCLERPASFSHIFCAHLRRLPPHSAKNMEEILIFLWHEVDVVFHPRVLQSIQFT